MSSVETATGTKEQTTTEQNQSRQSQSRLFGQGGSRVARGLNIEETFCPTDVADPDTRDSAREFQLFICRCNSSCHQHACGDDVRRSTVDHSDRRA